MYRILFVNHVGHISGAERVLQNLISHLDRTIYEPYFTIPTEGKLFEKLRNQGLTVFPLQTPLLIRSKNPVKLFQYIYYFWKTTKALKHLVENNKIDLIHANSFTAHLYCIVAAKLTHRPLIWHMHDIVTPRMISHLFVWLAGKMANKIIVVSNAVRDSLIGFGVSKDKIQTVYNGMNCELPIPSSDEKILIRNEFNIPNDTVLITMVGAITAWKGQDILLKAAAKIEVTKPLLHYLFVGDILLNSDIEYQQSLSAMVRQYQLESKVGFTGFRDDVSRIMTASDIIIHSSVNRADPLPTVILEAMLFEKPVIAVRVGGVPEIVEDGITGILYSMGNIDELVRAIKKLSENNELRKKMGFAGRKRVEKVFNINQNIENIQTIYAQLL
jgi:L-malate glycosyltransferase